MIRKEMTGWGSGRHKNTCYKKQKREREGDIIATVVGLQGVGLERWRTSDRSDSSWVEGERSLPSSGVVEGWGLEDVGIGIEGQSLVGEGVVGRRGVDQARMLEHEDPGVER